MLHAQESESVREARAGHMRLLRNQGLTLQEIADEYGITRERARQLLHRSVVEGTVIPAGEASRRRGERNRRKQKAQIATDVVAAYLAHPNVQEIARENGWLHDVVEEIVAEQFPPERRRALQGQRVSLGTRRHTDEQLIGFLRAAARSLHPGEYLTVLAYADYARERNLPGPQTVMKRLGGPENSWLDALAAAGLPGNPRVRRGPRRDRKWGHLQVLTAVAHVALVLGHMPTVVEYEAARNRVGRSKMPSIATIRNRTGSWAQASLQTRELLDEMGVTLND